MVNKTLKGREIAVIGAGISGLSIARMLQEKGARVTVYEKESTPGGLVRCERVNGILYHCVGGHVFNSRNPQVLDWFWKQCKKEDFRLATRHAVVSLADGSLVDYPIENHLYQMPDELRDRVLEDLLNIVTKGYPEADNFDDFLRNRFGETLYTEYFAPYNRKIWRRSLRNVSLSWLEGKLPMPTVKEILAANIGQVKEMKMVHSTFHYPQRNGSQYIANQLADGLHIQFNHSVDEIEKSDTGWIINGWDYTDVVYCANIKHLPNILVGITSDLSKVDKLEAHGTTSVLCEVQKTPYSWIYMPSEAHESHRIICTGNFAESNSPQDMATATIEFTQKLNKAELLEQLQRIPFSPRYIAHRYSPYTYPIQDGETRCIIESIKSELQPHRFYLLGRFAEWEYYNMDAAIEAAMKLSEKL